MHVIDIPLIGAWEVFRHAARRLAGSNVPSEAIEWRFGAAGSSLFADTPPANALDDLPAPEVLNVPRRYFALAEAAIAHSDSERFALAYAVLTRVLADRRLIDDPSDRQIVRLTAMARAVDRDSHKMKAFVRFRELGTGGDGRRRFGAWFEPSHHTLERTVAFFTRRFADMDWIIATPELTARFESGRIGLSATAERPDFGADATEALWKTYFAHIFNPARLKVKAMTAEMPKKYWRNLPEAELIPELISQAMPRNLAMQAAPATSIRPGAARVTARLAAARKEVPMSDDDPKSLTEARKSVEACRRCDLYACATRAVFGEGPGDATLMLIGEQPGDKEDLAGKPFVGPAGRLMNQIAEEAGLDRSACYVTNAVKHFKNEPRGKRRIHKKPDAGEVRACKWWLDKELSFVKPKLAVAMGATAALSLTGDGTGIMKRRGHIEKRDDGLKVLITVHPSSILRIRDDAAKEAQRKAFRNDLARAWSEAGKAA